jgi:hypothetical protein
MPDDVCESWCLIGSMKRGILKYITGYREVL